MTHFLNLWFAFRHEVSEVTVRSMHCSPHTAAVLKVQSITVVTLNHRCCPRAGAGFAGGWRIFRRAGGGLGSAVIQTTLCSNSEEEGRLVPQRSQALFSGDFWPGRRQPPQLLPPQRYVCTEEVFLFRFLLLYFQSWSVFTWALIPAQA